MGCCAVFSRACSRKPAMCLKQGKIRPRLLLMTNRKTHTRFRSMPKSTTLGDLERPLRTLFQSTIAHAFSEPTTKIWMKIDLHYSRRRCSAITLVSGSIQSMRIFAGIHWTAGVKRQWGCRKRQFSVLSRTVSSVALELRTTLLYRIIYSVAFSLTPKYMTLNDREWPFYYKFCFFFKFKISLFTYIDSAMMSMLKA